MNRKVFNTTGYHLGRNNSWHSFMDNLAKLIIGLGFILGVLIVVALVIAMATITIWA